MKCLDCGRDEFIANNAGTIVVAAEQGELLRQTMADQLPPNEDVVRCASCLMRKLVKAGLMNFDLKARFDPTGPTPDQTIWGRHYKVVFPDENSTNLGKARTDAIRTVVRRFNDKDSEEFCENMTRALERAIDEAEQKWLEELDL